mgnify:CR=1 FL=1
MSSRSANERYLPDSGFAVGLNIAGGMPPTFRNHLGPRGCDTPALSAATSLLIPVAINAQNSCRWLRVATGCRPGDRNGGRPQRSEGRFRMPIATSFIEVLRRPVASAQYASLHYTRRLADRDIAMSMSRGGCPYDNAKAESFMKTLKTEEVDGSAYRDLAHARSCVGDFIEQVYNRTRLHSALDYQSPMEFEDQTIWAGVRQPTPSTPTNCP